MDNEPSLGFMIGAAVGGGGYLSSVTPQIIIQVPSPLLKCHPPNYQPILLNPNTKAEGICWVGTNLEDCSSPLSTVSLCYDNVYHLTEEKLSVKPTL